MDHGKINWNRVSDAIQSVTRDSLIAGEAAELVWAAIEHFQRLDAERQVESVEQRFELDEPPAVGVVDLVLREPDGTRIIREWKVVESASWRDTYRQSWQPYVYLTMTHAERCEIVGIRAATGECQILRFEWSAKADAASRRWLAGASVMARSLFAAQMEPWPQQWSQCRWCPYKQVCESEKNYSIRLDSNRIADWRVSYSAASDLLRCPERLRLSLSLPEDDEALPPQMKLGKAVHAGLAEAYRHMMEE